MIPTFLGLSEFWSTAITILIGIVGAARLTRLMVNDDFPPVLWFRSRWNRSVNWPAGGFPESSKPSGCRGCMSRSAIPASPSRKEKHADQ